MGHTHSNTSEASSYGNHHKEQDKDRTNPISPWMLFKPDTKNFPEGDKEWELPHMDRPQQSKIVKAPASQHCNRPRKYVPGKEKPPIYKACKIRSRSWGRQKFSLRRINIKDSWAMRNKNPFKYQEKGFQWSHWSFTTQVKEMKFVCYGHVWLWYQWNPSWTNQK